MSDYFIRLQGLKNGTIAPTEKKKPTPIKKVSEKRKVLNKVYYKQAKIFLAKPENKNCKVGMAGCTKKTQCVHHVRGRIGSKLTDEKDWMASCLSCNLEIENKDAEAREKGFKKSKF